VATIVILQLAAFHPWHALSTQAIRAPMASTNPLHVQRVHTRRSRAVAPAPIAPLVDILPSSVAHKHVLFVLQERLLSPWVHPSALPSNASTIDSLPIIVQQTQAIQALMAPASRRLALPVSIKKRSAVLRARGVQQERGVRLLGLVCRGHATSVQWGRSEQTRARRPQVPVARVQVGNSVR
jgi:hypothetical protein